MKKIIVFANTMKKLIGFGKHYEKINSVFGKRPNISSALCSEFLLSCKKKLIEGPAHTDSHCFFVNDACCVT